MRKILLPAAIAIFGGALVVSWFTHGTGVVRNDPERHIVIPSALTVPLQVKAAYNGQTISFRYRWPAERPGIHHDVITFQGGRWVRRGGNVPGSQPQGLAEDRVAMMLDDGSVPEFARYGGYVAIAPGMLDLSDQASVEAVRASPLGTQLRQTEVSKFLPATRRNPAEWGSVVPDEELAALRRAGYFLDLWHWRGHRSNPIDVADDQYVFATRGSDTGRASYADNWDGQQNRPRFMFDPEKAGGRRAFAWNDLVQGRMGFDSNYALHEGNRVAFDPAAGWQEGDTVPRRLLQAPDRSRADIRVVAGQGRWANGFWEVTLRRAMDTGNPAEDKIILDRRVYNLAFAIHRNASGGRWHYVSLPVTLGVGRAGELDAVRHEGEEPRWEQPWHNVTLFYPGQVTWTSLNSTRHAGAANIARGVPVRFRHSEIQLAHYGVEREFADAIRRQWQFTLWGGVLLILAFGAALGRLLARKGE